MQRISSLIFNLSPKKMAIYLVLAPLVAFLIYIIVSIAFSTISDTSVLNLIGFSALSIFIALVLLLWLFWLKSAVINTNKNALHLPLRWFYIAYVMVWVYIIFNILDAFIIRNTGINNAIEEYLYLIRPLREFINTIGLIIAYPLFCYYAAMVTYFRKHNNTGSVIQVIPYTLLLIFGTVLSIPFFHNYFSKKTSKTSEILVIYGIALVVCIIAFIIGLLGAITGLL